jgi:hypothetical protein
MNWPASISLLGLGFVLGFASSDWRVEPEASMTLPQGSCDPAKTQVLRMDGSEQITQVIGRGVNCVVVVK